MPWIHGNQYIMYQINQSNPYVINCTMYQIVTFNICWTMLNQYGHGSMPWQPWHLGWGWVNGTFTGTIHLQVCCNASWRKITYQCSSRFPPPTRWMIYNVCVLSHRHPSLKSSYQTNSHHINPISYHSNPLTNKKKKLDASHVSLQLQDTVPGIGTAAAPSRWQCKVLKHRRAAGNQKKYLVELLDHHSNIQIWDGLGWFARR